MANCEDRQFTSPNGLEFRVECRTSSNSPELLRQPARDLDECMTFCSNFTSDLCYAVTYNPQTRVCALKNLDILDNGGSTFGDARTSIAFANVDQVTVTESTACPLAQASVFTTEEGKRYKILCDVEYRPELNPNDAGGRVHANTMQECMEYCSTEERCKGVSWNPDMGQGFANCIPKTTNDQTGADIPRGTIMHSATFLSQTETLNEPEGLTLPQKSGAIAGAFLLGMIIVGIIWFVQRRKERQEFENYKQEVMSDDGSEKGFMSKQSRNRTERGRAEQDDRRYPADLQPPLDLEPPRPIGGPQRIIDSRIFEHRVIN